MTPYRIKYCLAQNTVYAPKIQVPEKKIYVLIIIHRFGVFKTKDNHFVFIKETKLNGNPKGLRVL